MAEPLNPHQIEFPTEPHPTLWLTSLKGFVGGNLDVRTYLSPFGALISLMRLNRFARKHVFAAFGIKFQSSEDPSRVLAFSYKRRVTFSQFIGVDHDRRPGWTYEEWVPHHGKAPDPEVPWRTRICLPCMQEGFHAWLFQMPWVSRCPWHSTPLIDACPTCGRQLARAFLDEAPLLKCECGRDFFNRRKALRDSTCRNHARDRAFGDYLDWVQTSRSTQHLLVPSGIPQDTGALRELVVVPLQEHQVRSTGLHLANPFRARTHHNRYLAIRRELDLLDQQLGVTGRTSLEVPATWIPALQAIANGIALRVPPGSLYPVEAKRLLVSGLVATKPGASRTDILYLPVLSASGRAYLLGSCLPKLILIIAGDLIELTRMHWDDEVSAEQVLHTIRALVLHAYADGLKIVLGRHITGIYAHPRLRPWVHVPWIAVTKDVLGVSAIRMCWTREDPETVVGKKLPLGRC